MPADSHVVVKGTISDVHPGGQFRITTEHGGSVNAKLCGKMRQNKIRVILGDEVDVALSPYDLTHGIIVFRHK